jgi:Cu/Ag efflux protein CusF|tara:strand:+ start:938 stop:1369 length:432 start_codon:yes stop_codon:yes gene_type:complete
MKNIILIIFVGFSMIGIAQTKDGSFEKSIKYTSSKDDAFTNTLIWAAESFNNSNEVIKMKDKEAGVIVIKGAQSGIYRTSFTMTFKFKSEECSVHIKNWKETEYNYAYNDFENCYTKACKKNLAKWMAIVDSMGEDLVSRIEF